MNPTPHLRQLCIAGGDHTVAWVAGVARTGDDLSRTAGAIAAGLRQRPEHTWALWLTSPYEFLCSFMALALAGKRILLPANMQLGTVVTLVPHFEAVITRGSFTELEHPCFTPEQLASLLAEAGLAETGLAETGLAETGLAETGLAETGLEETGGHDAGEDVTQPNEQPGQHWQDIELLLFTSGSTGEPKAVRKTFALLEAELRILQQHWGEVLGVLPVVTTVSHQHIYGLLHLVLWPMLRRAPFIDEICQYPEELVARAQEQSAVVLISSPTHLKRLPLVDDFIRQHHNIRHIVSSGGLLESEAAIALARLMGSAPLEILGSTETGGVAWRQQDQSHTWRPLPGVSCRVDSASDCLSVRSEHLGVVSHSRIDDDSDAGAGWYVMGDLAQFHADGSFSLCGRADQIVKVEGKRLSITEMEARLQEHPLLNRARVAVVRTKREEVGVVVELSPLGQAHLERVGKLPLNQQLRDYLLTFFERPLLPRRWRYVAELPVNAQGKVLLADVQALLQQPHLQLDQKEV